MLLVILGAGASYDSFSPRRPPASRPDPTAAHEPQPSEDYRPPLTLQLFDGRANFARALSLYPEVRQLAPSVVSAIKRGDQIERYLSKLSEEAERLANDKLKRELRALRFYIREVIDGCANNWPWSPSVSTNYDQLVGDICRWQARRNNEPALFVTFNYDTLLDRALSDAYDVDFQSAGMGSYVSSDKFRLVKLHGSTNWGRRVLLPSDRTPNNAEARSDPGHVARHMIQTDQYEILDEFGFLPRNGFATSSGGPPERPAVVWMPAIAIPLDSKPDFECPSEHVAALREWLPRVDRVLVVGWRATEERFVRDLLWQQLRRQLPLQVVSGPDSGAEEGTGTQSVFLNLDHLEPRQVEQHHGVGFSQYLDDDGLATLFGA